MKGTAPLIVCVLLQVQRDLLSGPALMTPAELQVGPLTCTLHYVSWFTALRSPAGDAAVALC